MPPQSFFEQGLLLLAELLLKMRILQLFQTIIKMVGSMLFPAGVRMGLIMKSPSARKISVPFSWERLP